jgi:ssDNA-binding Zn-finger/Zn-ribbon topoisomerase 1
MEIAGIKNTIFREIYKSTIRKKIKKNTFLVFSEHSKKDKVARAKNNSPNKKQRSTKTKLTCIQEGLNKIRFGKNRKRNASDKKRKFKE